MLKLLKQILAYSRNKNLFDSISEGAWKLPGGRLNKKDGLTRYGDSHVKDKTS